MTLTLDIAPEAAEALTQAATSQGRSREELASETLNRLFLPTIDIAGLLAENGQESDLPLSESGFLMAAEGTRHIWDTPEEDKAWAHL